MQSNKHNSNIQRGLAGFIGGSIVGIIVGLIGGALFSGLFASVIVAVIARVGAGILYFVTLKTSHDGLIFAHEWWLSILTSATVSAISAGISGGISRTVIRFLISRNWSVSMVNKIGFTTGMIAGGLSSMGISMIVSTMFINILGDSGDTWNLELSVLAGIGGGILSSDTPISITINNIYTPNLAMVADMNDMNTILLKEFCERSTSAQRCYIMDLNGNEAEVWGLTSNMTKLTYCSAGSQITMVSDVILVHGGPDGRVYPTFKYTGATESGCLIKRPITARTLAMYLRDSTDPDIVSFRNSQNPIKLVVCFGAFGDVVGFNTTAKILSQVLNRTVYGYRWSIDYNYVGSNWVVYRR